MGDKYIVTLLLTLLISTHEPPSSVVQQCRLLLLLSAMGLSGPLRQEEQQRRNNTCELHVVAPRSAQCSLCVLGNPHIVTARKRSTLVVLHVTWQTPAVERHLMLKPPEAPALLKRNGDQSRAPYSRPVDRKQVWQNSV